MWLMATILDSADVELCHYHSKFYWVALDKSSLFTGENPDSWSSGIGPRTHSRSGTPGWPHNTPCCDICPLSLYKLSVWVKENEED